MSPQQSKLDQVSNEKATAFHAGKIKQFLPTWETLTSDPFILKSVSGAEIQLNERPETKNHAANQIQGNLKAETETEVQKLLDMGVIEFSQDEEGQFVCPIFLVPKPDGTYRLILNLKEFNENVTYEHFKIENLQCATKMLRKNCFMASVDFKHAYYSVPVAKEFQKFLKFKWKGQLYCFTCLPNGLALCPRLFTKIMKPVFATLRQQVFFFFYLYHLLMILTFKVIVKMNAREILTAQCSY